MQTESNDELTDAVLCADGRLITPDGSVVTRGSQFSPRRAHVREMRVRAGFHMPGGWGGAGAGAWHDDGADVPCDGLIRVTVGTPAVPSVWSFAPADVKEDWEANRAAYTRALAAMQSEAACR